MLKQLIFYIDSYIVLTPFRSMARAKRHFIPGYIWNTPVKQRKKD